MNKIHLHHYGCSFTENIKGFGLSNLFSQYEYHNHSKESSSNFLIFDTFYKTATPNSIAVIQWSSITRPGDTNFPFDEFGNLLKPTDNPLFDLLEQWYGLLDKTLEVCKERNIKLLHYIGWAHWKDNELDDYHRTKLKSYGIHWFHSLPQWDEIQSNCFQFQLPHQWSSFPNEETNLSFWDDLEWGGVSEWIRENVELGKRYMGFEGRSLINPANFNVHPSQFGKSEFVQKFLIPQLELLNKK